MQIKQSLKIMVTKSYRERDLELGISSFRKIVAVRAKRTMTAKQTEVSFREGDAIREASFFSVGIFLGK